MVWAQLGTQYWTGIHIGVSWTSQAFSGVHRLSDSLCYVCSMLPLLCRLDQLLCFMISFTTSLLLSPCSLSIRGLKPVCSLTFHFLFLAPWIACICLLEFPCSVSSSLCNASQRGGHLLPYRPSVSFLWTVITFVTLGYSRETDSSASSPVMPYLKSLCASVYFPIKYNHT